MKQTLFTLLSGASLALSSHAGIIAYEGFAYPAGDLNSNNAGTGFSGAWANQLNGSQTDAQTTGLTFSDLAVSGGLAQVTANKDNVSTVSRSLNSSLTGIFYGGFLVNETNRVTNGGVAGIVIGNASVDDNVAPLVLHADEFNQDNGAVRLAGTSTVHSGSAITVGTTYGGVQFSVNQIEFGRAG